MGKRRLLAAKKDVWDSSFFGLKIARINLRGKKERGKDFPEKLSATVQELKKKQFNFLVVRLCPLNRVYEIALKQAGFVAYDRGVNFIFSGQKVNSIRKFLVFQRGPSNEPNNLQKAEGEVKVRPFKKTDLEILSRIAAYSFRLSYLYKCGFAPSREVDRYHSVWIANLCRDSSCRVWVAEKEGKVCGFLALKVDKKQKCGKIILVAVARKYRGSGVGKMLIGRCLKEAEGLGPIYVRTQMTNRRARKFYEEAGFRVFNYDRTFCWRIK